MITLDTLRSAMLSAQPYDQLHELVTGEMAAGRKVKDIFNSINPLVDDALETPGLTEDGEEALLGTLDALTGDCHPNCQYKDPPNTTLPTEEEIAKLPRWARVAFAARCARRVLVIYSVIDARRWVKYAQILESAIELAELSATLAEVSNFTKQMRNEISNIGTAEWTGWDDAGRPQDQEASYLLVRTVWHAVYTTETSKFVTTFTTRSPDRSSAAAAKSVGIPIEWYLRRDFDHLASLAEGQKWDDDTPVPPEVFGPLWPEGPPKGWPPITDVPQRAELVIEAFARERATEQIIEDDIVNLFNALNRYHIARSGVRLTLEQFRSLLPAFVPAEV